MITNASDYDNKCFYFGKTPNVASSPQRLSGPLHIVEFGGQTHRKVDECANASMCHFCMVEKSCLVAIFSR